MMKRRIKAYLSILVLLFALSSCGIFKGGCDCPKFGDRSANAPEPALANNN